MSNGTAAAPTRQELIAFRIGAQEFCVDIMTVREIRGWTQTTPLPHARREMRGVINLRGAVLPIIDLRASLGFGLTEPEARHVIVVVRHGGQEAGLLVDAVLDILTVQEASIQPVPQVANVAVAPCLKGMIAFEGRMISVIGLEHVLPQAYAVAA